MTPVQPSLPRDASARIPGDLLRRTFGSATWCLSLERGTCVELEGGAAAILAEAAGGAPQSAITERLAQRYALDRAVVAGAIASVFAALGQSGDTIHPSIWANAAREPRFRPAAWSPPDHYPGRKFESLPSKALWLLHVAGVSTADRAEAAIREWSALSPPGASLRQRRAMTLALGNLAAWDRNAPFSDPPPLLRETWAANEIALHRVQPLLQMLHREGIPAAFIKGAASVLDDYRDTALRPMGDLDLLVPEAAFPPAMAVLRRAGFTNRLPGGLLSKRHVLARHGFSHERSDGMKVDLHRHVLWTNLNRSIDGPLWPAARETTLHGTPCLLPDPSMRLLVICVHGLRWGPGGSRTWPADAAMLLAAHGDVLDWDAFLREVRARHVVRASREALHYLVDALGAPIPREVLDALRRAKTALFEDAVFEQGQKSPGGPAARIAHRIRCGYRTRAVPGVLDAIGAILVRGLKRSPP